jgi:hypothetical protein
MATVSPAKHPRTVTRAQQLLNTFTASTRAVARRSRCRQSLVCNMTCTSYRESPNDTTSHLCPGDERPLLCAKKPKQSCRFGLVPSPRRRCVRIHHVDLVRAQSGLPDGISHGAELAVGICGGTRAQLSTARQFPQLVLKYMWRRG